MYDFYITGTIGVAYDWWTGQRGTTAKDVQRFLEENKDKEVTIAVSSPGGYLDEGITICELIAKHKKCNMVIIGMTASAATLLCMKAKSVKIARGSMMLIHNSAQMLSIWTSANKQKIDEIISAFQKQRDELDTFDKAIASIYASRNGKSIEEIMQKMDEEKWMLPEDAISFGIVDGYVEDEKAETQARTVNMACASREGFVNHFGLPSMPIEDEGERRSLWQRMAACLSSVVGVMNNTFDLPAETNESTNNQNSNQMKTIILNFVCACLAIAGIPLNEKGEATLTEDQLNKLEDSLKSKDAIVNDLQEKLKAAEAAKAAAETAKATAEEDLQKLRKEFDEFKNEAGGSSSTHVEENSKQHTAASMYNEIKDLLQ